VTGREHPLRVGGLARALEIVGERWTLLIVREAMTGVSRFDDFHARLGVSRKSLSARLGLLVEHGLMTKTPYQQRPIRCDYRLTRKGIALQPAIAALTAWGDAHAFRRGIATATSPPALRAGVGGDGSARCTDPAAVEGDPAAATGDP